MSEHSEARAGLVGVCLEGAHHFIKNAENTLPMSKEMHQYIVCFG